MSDIVLSLINIITVVSVTLVVKYLIPFLKAKLSTEKLAIVSQWARYAVLTAQNTLTSSSGAEKKKYVTDFLKEILAAKNITTVTDEMLDILIESAVKTMKMSEQTQSQGEEADT